MSSMGTTGTVCWETSKLRYQIRAVRDRMRAVIYIMKAIIS